MPITLFNGQLISSGHAALYADDRGFHYGDGIFETMRLVGGRVRFLEDHWQRLILGCARLGIAAPSIDVLNFELDQLIKGQEDGVIKLVVSRGRSERGYRPPMGSQSSRLWQLHTSLPQSATHGIQIRWCTTRLARNERLAGIKHCNRLEQILAQAEWSDPAIAEGLMLDTDGELVCATMSNVFLVLDQVIVTPDLRYAGVEGVMRKNVLCLADQLGLSVELRAVRAEEVARAEEIFLTNAVRGIQPVIKLDQQSWSVGSMTQQLIMALNHSS
jgi:4-amino-4-deoxychorismate lyase